MRHFSEEDIEKILVKTLLKLLHVRLYGDHRTSDYPISELGRIVNVRVLKRL